MILCDIGNSFYHFYKSGALWKESTAKSAPVFDEELFVISVNDSALKALKAKNRVLDISDMLHLDSDYVGIGADRAYACYAAHDGLVVDAGSAITVDVMQEGFHLGGYIMPGIGSLAGIYPSISERLSCGFNMGVELDRLPQSTKDAISYGAIYPIVSSISQASKGKFIYFTGGDGKYLSKFFNERSIVDETLVFKGMLKLMQKEKIC